MFYTKACLIFRGCSNRPLDDSPVLSYLRSVCIFTKTNCNPLLPHTPPPPYALSLPNICQKKKNGKGWKTTTISNGHQCQKKKHLRFRGFSTATNLGRLSNWKWIIWQIFFWQRGLNRFLREIIFNILQQ